MTLQHDLHLHVILSHLTTAPLNSLACLSENVSKIRSRIDEKSCDFENRDN